MPTESTIYYLELSNPDQLSASANPQITPRLERVEIASPALNRFFYTAIGGDWFWIDRLSWSYQRWQQYLDNPNQQTWVLYARGAPAGYFELDKRQADVELAYFGLLPQFTGKRLGGWLLTEAIKSAWAMDAGRVWVHTCSEDHPSALKNYQSRGFRIFKQEKKLIELPEQPIGPWDGCLQD